MKPLYRNPFGTLWASVLYAENLGVLITLPAFAAAQEWTRAAAVDDIAGHASATAREANDLDLEQVIVTAVPGNPSSKLNTSLSVPPPWRQPWAIQRDRTHRGREHERGPVHQRPDL
jgi:hypothetical protein